MSKIPRDVCTCRALASDETAAKIPDLQPAENIFNLVTMELQSWAKQEGWPSNKKELKSRISHILDNIDKSWFRNIFSSLPKRWRKVVQLKGEMSDFLTPKSH